MTTHWELSDDLFLSSFATGKLAPELFTHEAHLRLAWLHLDRYGLEDATQAVSQQILAYVAGLGAQDKYHHTLTVAAVQIVAHFRQRTATNDLPGLLREFPRLLHDFKGLIESHYSPTLYQSDAARTQYLEPDVLPFPETGIE